MQRGSRLECPLQLIQDHIEYESLDKKPEKALLELLTRETELRKNKGIPSDTLLNTRNQKVNECKEAVRFGE